MGRCDLISSYLPRFLVSTPTALVQECQYMGWPHNPESGTNEITRYLAECKLPSSHGNVRVDLYSALNYIRGESWKKGSQLWSNYVSSRRDEVGVNFLPRNITLQLTRTIDASSSRRLRLPLPLSHPAQKEATWNVARSSCFVGEQRVGPGFVELEIDSSSKDCSATILYHATLTPQVNATCCEQSYGQLTGMKTPFAVPLNITTDLSAIARISTPREKLFKLWELFHDNLFSGHVYHHERLAINSAASDRYFDCVVASWNFASLAEQLGIPARVLSGVIINSFGPSPHFWCEVGVDGLWQPIDFYAWDLSQGDNVWRDKFFCSLDARLRFECYPQIFSRFLPNIPWFIERRLAGSGSSYTYRCLESSKILATDEWRVVA